MKTCTILKIFVAAGGTAALGSAPASAELLEFRGWLDGPEMTAWLEAVGEPAVLDFVGIGLAEPIDDQYLEEFGVNFTGWEYGYHEQGFVDGFGLRNAFAGDAVLEFDSPVHTFAYTGPGFELVTFYLGGEIVAESASIATPFTAWVSDQPFDRVVISNSDFVIDDFYLANDFVPIPGPAGLGLFAAALAAGCSRRRLGRDV